MTVLGAILAIIWTVGGIAFLADVSQALQTWEEWMKHRMRESRP